MAFQYRTILSSQKPHKHVKLGILGSIPGCSERSTETNFSPDDLTPFGKLGRSDRAQEFFQLARCMWTHSEQHQQNIKPVFPLGEFVPANNKKQLDWLVMTSVFVASQSSCFFLCSREQIR